MALLVAGLAPNRDLLAGAHLAVRVLIGALILAAAATGLAFVGATTGLPQVPADIATGSRRRYRTLWERIPRGMFTLGALSPLLVVLILDDLARAGLARTGTTILRAVLWCLFVVGAISLLHRTPHSGSSGVVDCDRALRLASPTVLLLVGVGVASVLDRSLATAEFLLGYPIALAGFASLAVVPTILVSSAVEGLRKVQKRGVRLSVLVEHRPQLLVLVLVVKLVIIGLIFLIGRSLLPERSLLSSSTASWMGSVLAGLLVLALLSLDRRIGLAATHHLLLSRFSGALLGGVLGALAGVVLLVTVLNSAAHRPWTLAGLVVVLVLGVVAGRGIRWRWRLAVYLTACIAGLGASVLSVRSIAFAPPRISSAIFDETWSKREIVLVLVVALVLAIGCLCVAAVIHRRTRLLTYLFAVTVWTLLLFALDRLDADTTQLNIDLALTGLLLLAAITWLAKLQHEIDGVEVMVTAAVTFAVIDFPFFLDILPGGWQAVVLIFALLGPGLASLWKETSLLRDPTRTTKALRHLGVTCLAYALLTAVVWAADLSAARLMDDVSTAFLGFLLVPLALLLVAASSAGRHKHKRSARNLTVTPPPSGRTRQP